MPDILAALRILVALQNAACQSAAGVPCFSLTYEHSAWALVKSPVRDMVTTEVAGTMAVSADGSFVHISQPTKRFAVRGSRAPGPPLVRMYVAATGQQMAPGESQANYDFRLPELFFLDRVYRRAPSADSCRSWVAGLSPKNLTLTGQATLLGEAVANWKFTTAFGESTVAIAPELDCQVLRMETVEYRYRYLPVRKELFEAKTLRRGQPAASLFTVPKGK